MWSPVCDVFSEDGAQAERDETGTGFSETETKLSERIGSGLPRFARHQKTLDDSLAVIGIVGLVIVGFGIYDNLGYDFAERLYNPSIDWVTVGSWFIFICYVCVFIAKLCIRNMEYRERKEYLSARRREAYMAVHPPERELEFHVNAELARKIEEGLKI